MKLGSIFDGIGGFPLAGMMHGIEPVWASEIEPFPIAVTKKRFPNMKHLGSVTDINGAEIERLLNQTGRTLEGLPKQDEHTDREDYRHRRVDPQEDGNQQGEAV